VYAVRRYAAHTCTVSVSCVYDVQAWILRSIYWGLWISLNMNCVYF